MEKYWQNYNTCQLGECIVEKIEPVPEPTVSTFRNVLYKSQTAIARGTQLLLDRYGRMMSKPGPKILPNMRWSVDQGSAPETTMNCFSSRSELPSRKVTLPDKTQKIIRIHECNQYLPSTCDGGGRHHTCLQNNSPHHVALSNVVQGMITKEAAEQISLQVFTAE